MPTISKEKKDKISEQILHFLFLVSPEAKFTAEVAREIARDEEFTKFLLLQLNKKELVTEIRKNPSGVQYIRRQRWRLSNEAFKVYSNYQPPSQQSLY